MSAPSPTCGDGRLGARRKPSNAPPVAAVLTALRCRPAMARRASLGVGVPVAAGLGGVGRSGLRLSSGLEAALKLEAPTDSSLLRFQGELAKFCAAPCCSSTRHRRAGRREIRPARPAGPRELLAARGRPGSRFPVLRRWHRRCANSRSEASTVAMEPAAGLDVNFGWRRVQGCSLQGEAMFRHLSGVRMRATLIFQGLGNKVMWKQLARPWARRRVAQQKAGLAIDVDRVGCRPKSPRPRLGVIVQRGHGPRRGKAERSPSRSGPATVRARAAVDPGFPGWSGCSRNAQLHRRGLYCRNQAGGQRAGDQGWFCRPGVEVSACERSPAGSGALTGRRPQVQARSANGRIAARAHQVLPAALAADCRRRGWAVGRRTPGHAGGAWPRCGRLAASCRCPPRRRAAGAGQAAR